jgi:1-deoxy-D-xylulose-5-phosphate reductoisomerase
LNAANEVGVDAFLNRQIRFDQIHHVNQAVLDRLNCDRPNCLEDLLALDIASRDAARRVIERLA